MRLNSLCIIQGRWDYIINYYGGLEQVAQRIAAHKYWSLTHGFSLNDGVFPKPCGCNDLGQPAVPELISRVKEINPGIKIFAYVSGTADAPSGCGYGAGNEYSENKWVKNGINGDLDKGLRNFRFWADKWDAFDHIDGFMIDLVASQWISESIRDRIYMYCRHKGKSIMANSTWPSKENVAFAAEGLISGDFVLCEGFRYALGYDTLAGSNDAMAEMNRRRYTGVKLAALCTMPWSTTPGQTVNPADWPNANAVSLMQNFGAEDDLYQYDRGNLGINTFAIPLPAVPTT
jgi:hypothetical protein